MVEGSADGAGREDPRVILIGRPGCHLCDDARAVVHRVCERLGVAWTEVALGDRPEWGERYADLIPVVLVDGVEHACWRVDPDALERSLR